MVFQGWLHANWRLRFKASHLSYTNILTDEKLPTNNDFLIGGVVTPFTAKPGWPAQNLTEKIDAGAQFMITHTCLDMEIIKIYMERLIATKLLRRMHLIAGIAILKSAEDAKDIQMKLMQRYNLNQ